MYLLDAHKRTAIISALAEGVSIRATGRIVDAQKDTVMRLGLRVGEGASKLHDRLFQGLRVRYIEIDEAWSYIFKKQKRRNDSDPIDWGDQYIFIGIDSDKKTIISYRVGKRDGRNTMAFAKDLRSRVVGDPQISSDGFEPYIKAVRATFGANADYAMLVKNYEAECAVEAARRYSPGDVTSTEKRIISGSPRRSRISTAYVERQNLTLRMELRRLTRLTNGFSKKLRNHAAAIALYVAHFNLCRYHQTLEETPAMAAGVADHQWTIDELVRECLALSVPREAHDLYYELPEGA